MRQAVSTLYRVRSLALQPLSAGNSVEFSQCCDCITLDPQIVLILSTSRPNQYIVHCFHFAQFHTHMLGNLHCTKQSVFSMFSVTLYCLTQSSPLFNLCDASAHGLNKQLHHKLMWQNIFKRKFFRS